MKRNLVKILALSSIVLALGACQPNRDPKPVVIALNDAFKQTDGVFENEGKSVILENLSVYSSFGNTLLAGYPLAKDSSYYLKDVKSIEVELPELPKWSSDGNKYGIYADVTVQGKLTNVNGRPVLKDASCTVNREAKYDSSTGARIYEGDVSNYALPYYSEEHTNRSNFDKLTVENSGALMEGVFQLATVPSGVTNEAESSFKVVFPGENINGEDPTNEHAITVRIPKGIGTRGVNFVNSFFEGMEKGEFVLLDAFSHFDSSTGGMGLLFEGAIGPSYTDEVPEEDRPVIISQWSDIQARYEGKFKGVEVPDLGTNLAFSYTLKDNFSGSIGDLVGEEYVENWKLDQTKAGSFMVTANTGSAHADEAFEQIKQKAAALTGGWALDEDLTDEIADDFYYVLKESDAEDAAVIAEFNFFLEGSSIGIIFAGIRATDAQVSTFAEAIAQYESVVGRDVPGFASALPSLPAGAESALTGVACDWKGYEDVEGLGLVEFYPEFTEGTFANDEAWQAAGQAYINALLAGGFVADYTLPIYGLDGYYNATSKEFVFVTFSKAEDNSINGLVMYAFAVTNATKAAAHLFNVADDSVWTADLAKAYAVDGFIATFDEGTFNVGSNYIQSKYVWGQANVNALINALYSNAVPACASTDGQVKQDEGDYYIDFYLPSETEGKVVLVEILLSYEDHDGTAYYNPVMLFGLVDAE